MKKILKKGVILLILTLMVLQTAGSACRAELLEPRGQGQIGWSAVVLFDGLAVHQDPGDGSETVRSLRFGDRIIVSDIRDGWAECFLSDSVDEGPAGWVSADRILVDPAWYRTDEPTPLYAWNDTSAPQIALLDGDAFLPILKNDGEWIVVAQSGAAGWIPVGADALPEVSQ